MHRIVFILGTRPEIIKLKSIIGHLEKKIVINLIVKFYIQISIKNWVKNYQIYLKQIMIFC